MRYWVAGWGVAALAGVQTRTHRDLDLAVDAATLPACLQALELLGYAQETDWLPVRVEYAAPGELWVDVHPVTFDDAGHGRQHDLDGGHFDYPPEGFGLGSIENRVIPCLSAARQRVFTPATNRAHRTSTIFACWPPSTSDSSSLCRPSAGYATSATCRCASRSSRRPAEVEPFRSCHSAPASRRSRR